MRTHWVAVAALAALSISTLRTSAQTKSGLDTLYVLNCGEGVAGDISRWSPGVNIGKSMDMSENCYLIHHTQGWLLWDTGLPDALAAMPNGQAPADPRRTEAANSNVIETFALLAAQGANNWGNLVAWSQRESVRRLITKLHKLLSVD
jgi:hypothetical protein